MKKILGISLVAVLAATPLMARAADLTETEMGHATVLTGDNNKMATVSYVKGAYTELGNAINTKADKTALTAEENRAKNAEAGLQAAITTLNGDDQTEGSVDKKIADAISEVNTAAETLEGRVTANANAITTLNGNAETAGSVAYAVKAEETRATGVESGLNTRLTTAEGDIDTLEAAVNNATTGLATRASQADLASEVNRATGAEGVLSGRITAIENVQGDYATKTGVNNTINALEYTTTLREGSSVTGTVSVPTSGTVATVTDWANQTPGTAVVSFSNSDIALANGTVASATLATVATTANYATANNEQ